MAHGHAGFAAAHGIAVPFEARERRATRRITFSLNLSDVTAYELT
jgi:hypothetical protein